MKKALITGVAGQDGSYLTEHLLSKGYEVWGTIRKTHSEALAGANNAVHMVHADMQDIASLRAAIGESKPDEIYNLAAQTDVGLSFKQPEMTMEINYFGLGRLVNEAMKLNPSVRICQASTSEMFGKAIPPQSEQTPLAPVSPYGESKAKAHEDYVVGYRERHNLFICSAILFNHESPRRGVNFVTRKITSSLSKIKLGLQEHVSLGNLEARRDWGFAGDYVQAMHLMLGQEKPSDYVLSSGTAHSVREFVEAACKELNMPIVWKGEGLDEVGMVDDKVILMINKDFYRPVEVAYSLGDNTKARQELGWKPEVTFQGLVSMMVQSDLALHA
jgi:GDPmannose 4,6-dehydratase